MSTSGWQPWAPLDDGPDFIVDQTVDGVEDRWSWSGWTSSLLGGEGGPVVDDQGAGAPNVLSRGPAASAAASRRRSELLARVVTGGMGLHEAIRSAAAGDPGLDRVMISSLVSSQPGVGTGTTRRVMARFMSLVGRAPARGERLRVHELLNNDTRGSRLIALVDAASPAPTGPPWPGFPFSPQPGPLSAAGAPSALEEDSR